MRGRERRKRRGGSNVSAAGREGKGRGEGGEGREEKGKKGGWERKSR